MTIQAAFETSTSKSRATDGIVIAIGILDNCTSIWEEANPIMVSRRSLLVPSSRNVLSMLRR
jgi:hypothetical protein